MELCKKKGEATACTFSISEPAAAMTGLVFLVEAKPAVRIRPPSKALRIVPRGVDDVRDCRSTSWTARTDRRLVGPERDALP